MRIGLFTDIYLPSVYGTELATERVRRTLESMGHKVYVFAPETPGYVDGSRRVLRFRSQRITSSPESRLAFSLLPVGRSYREVLDLRLDVAQAQTVGAMGILARRIAQHQDIPLLYAHHSMYPAYAGSESADAQLVPSLVRTYTKWFAGRADAILAPTAKVERLLRGWGIGEEVPIHILPTGVDPTVFRRNAAAGRRLRAALGLDEAGIVLITVSRLVREKNIEFLLEAFRRMRRSVPGAVLLIVGDGGHRRHLEQHARRLGISAHTLFAGQVASGQVASYYQAADMFVFPSVIESQGLVVLEALSSGLPVVTLEDDAYARFVRDGITGRLVSPHTPAEFARAAASLANDAELLARTSRAAVRLAHGFTLEKLAQQLLSIYGGLIEQKRSARRARAGRRKGGRR